MTEVQGKLLTRIKFFASGAASEQGRDLGRVVGIADLPRAIGAHVIEGWRDILKRGVVVIARGWSSECDVIWQVFSGGRKGLILMVMATILSDSTILSLKVYDGMKIVPEG